MPPTLTVMVMREPSWMGGPSRFKPAEKQIAFRGPADVIDFADGLRCGFRGCRDYQRIDAGSLQRDNLGIDRGVRDLLRNFLDERPGVLSKRCEPGAIPHASPAPRQARAETAPKQLPRTTMGRSRVWNELTTPSKF
jgi:hypothetical protein